MIRARYIGIDAGNIESGRVYPICVDKKVKKD